MATAGRSYPEWLHHAGDRDRGRRSRSTPSQTPGGGGKTKSRDFLAKKPGFFFKKKKKKNILLQNPVLFPSVFDLPGDETGRLVLRQPAAQTKLIRKRSILLIRRR